MKSILLAISAVLALASSAVAQPENTYTVPEPPQMGDIAPPETVKAFAIDNVLAGQRLPDGPIYRVSDAPTPEQIDAIEDRFIGHDFGEWVAKAADFVVGLGQVVVTDQAEVDVVGEGPDHIEVIARDETGKPTLDGTVAVANPDGTVNLPYQQTIPEAALSNATVRFDLIADHSGSMFGALPQVKAELLRFIDSFPGALCRVTFFSGRATMINQGQGDDGFVPCASVNFNVDHIKIGGGTRPAPVIRKSLADLSVPATSAKPGTPNIRACVIVTDGQNLAAKDAEEFAQSDVKCLVYYIGTGVNKTSYSRFAAQAIDIRDEPDVKAALERFGEEFIFTRILTTTDPNGPSSP